MIQTQRSELVRRALTALSTCLDGSRASANTVTRKRRTFSACLKYAVDEKGLLAGNPLSKVSWKAPKGTDTIDRRVVASPQQVRTLLAAVKARRRDLVASTGASTSACAAQQRPERCAGRTANYPKEGPDVCCSVPPTRWWAGRGQTMAGPTRTAASNTVPPRRTRGTDSTRVRGDARHSYCCGRAIVSESGSGRRPGQRVYLRPRLARGTPGHTH